MTAIQLGLTIYATTDIDHHPQWLRENGYRPERRNEKCLWYHKRAGQVTATPDGGRGWSLLVPVVEN